MTRSTLAILTAALAPVLPSCGGATPSGGSAPPSAAPAGAEVPTTVLEGVYTEVQADRGAEVFRDSCSECHGSREFRGETFFLNYDGISVGRFVDQLARTMPDGAPGSLPRTHYVDVTAYILRLNEFPTGAAELPDRMEILNAIRIERAGGAR